MGIYWDNKIYGIRWCKLDKDNESYCVMYEYKSNQELKIEDFNEIKPNFDLIDKNELDNYIFDVYNQASSTLEPNSMPYMMWNKINFDFLKSLF